MAPDEPGLPRPIRWLTGFGFAVQVFVAAASLIGGFVAIVDGALDGDGGRVAYGVVGVLLGGAFAAMAHGHWSTRRATE